LQSTGVSSQLFDCFGSLEPGLDIEMPNEPRRAEFADVAIIGAGPAGMSAALLLGRCCRSVVVYDDRKPRNRAARATHGYLTRDGISPSELREQSLREVTRYGVTVRELTIVTARPRKAEVEDFPTSFHLTDSSDESLIARKLLISAGVRDDLPSISGIEQCYGVSVHHCPYCDAWEHRDQPIATMGRTPHDVLGLALTVRTWSGDIIALSHGELFSAAEKERLRHNGIGFREAPVQSLRHEDSQLQHIELGGGELVRCQALFVDFGYRARSEILEQLGYQQNPKIAKAGKKQESILAGLFVAGDITGDVQMLATATGDGAKAAVAINRELQDEDEYRRVQGVQVQPVI
jgi:thioredoxin reductase